MQSFAEEICECYRRADACTRGAEAARDQIERTKFNDMRSRWLLLAHSYEFSERLSRMTDRRDVPN